MALVPCRECGKEVSDQAQTCPNCGIKTPSKKAHQRKMIVTGVVILLIVSVCAYGYHKVSQAFSPAADPASTTSIATPSKIQKDIPVKQQVIQKNSKDIIKEMLDSGKSVGYISKQTGLRRDEIRKIKKEKEAAEGGK